MIILVDMDNALVDFDAGLLAKWRRLYPDEFYVPLESRTTLLASGHDVRFCTSHFMEYTHCVFEKFQWVEEHFDASFVDRIVLTRDKTLIRGDILIDDKPVITGIAKPTWEHILYDRPFNRDSTHKKRLTWKNWQEILGFNVSA